MNDTGTSGGTVEPKRRAGMSTMHGYYLAQGYESCPECGHWLLPQTSRPSA